MKTMKYNFLKKHQLLFFQLMSAKIKQNDYTYIYINYNFDFACTVFISFSSFMAWVMSPLILSLPVMNACMEFSSPRNIFPKSTSLMTRVHVGVTSADPSITRPKTREHVWPLILAQKGVKICPPGEYYKDSKNPWRNMPCSYQSNCFFGNFMKLAAILKQQILKILVL